MWEDSHAPYYFMDMHSYNQKEPGVAVAVHSFLFVAVAARWLPEDKGEGGEGRGKGTGIGGEDGSPLPRGPTSSSHRWATHMMNTVALIHI
jgi:hypothetical protein